MKKKSIGTARHLHPPGTPQNLNVWHNRAALAVTAAAVARARGLDERATDAELGACADEARGGAAKTPPSRETLAAIRTALGAPLTRGTAPAEVASALFAALPDRPLRIVAPDGQEFFLVPIAAT